MEDIDESADDEEGLSDVYESGNSSGDAPSGAQSSSSDDDAEAIPLQQPLGDGLRQRHVHARQ